MENVIIIAIISFLGTCVGTFGGILTANKLTNYRIEQLERKVEKHNGIIERLFVVEQKTVTIEHRIGDLEKVL